MSRWIAVLWVGLWVGCDEPDEVYHRPPKDFDPAAVNGNAPVGVHYDGSHPFVDPPDEGGNVPSVEVCTDAEVAERWAAMVAEPILPMIGSAGLDMRGGEEWAGLTIEQAQEPERLCQAIYYDATGVAAWGDYFEVIAFFDPTTRQINDLLVTPGYLGVIDAGDFVFEINEPIMRRGVALSRGDGSTFDPKTDDNMRDMDRALIRAFRPGLDADQVDCIEAGACYVIDSGSVPFLVFTSVDIYVPLEPVGQRIVQIETALKRPFRIGTGRFEATSVTPTLYGTAVGGIPGCEITYGTDWADIEADCLGGDPLAMAEITPAFGYEQVLVQLGGILLYLDRPGLPADEILPYDPTPQAGDTVALISINAGFEGQVEMPYSDMLRAFRTNLDAAIRAEVPELPPEEPTGALLLRTPDDPDLPASVQDRYPDRMRPGGLFAAFCTDDGDDGDTEYDECFTDASGRQTLPLTFTISGLVADTLGPRLTPKLADSAFYVQEVHRALGEAMNGAPLTPDQVIFAADEGAPDRIYATMSLPLGGVSYTFNAYYGGNDDRLHFMNFQRGGTRLEDVLLEDAALETPTDPDPSGVFTLDHLLGSPRLGLGAIGTIEVIESRPDTRRALLDVWLSIAPVSVLAPFLEASSTTGYWIPQEGPHDLFQQAAWLNLYGNSTDAELYLADAGDGSGFLEIVAASSTQFFGDAAFCGFGVRIGDFVDDLLEEIEDAGYPCRLIVGQSENRENVTSVSDLDSQVQLTITNGQITKVFVWAR